MPRGLAHAIIGLVLPNRGDIESVPEPYRTTALQSRALMKMKGSQPVEPSEEDIPPITEEPTRQPTHSSKEHYYGIPK